MELTLALHLHSSPGSIEAASEEVVAQAAAGLHRSGFVNYFGLQRFGTGAVPTHR